MELSAEKAQQWVDKEVDPEVKKIKRKILANVNYVSAKEFKKNLSIVSVEAFQKINGDYVVLWDYKAHSSKRWVFHQIQSILPRKPVLATYFAPTADKVIGVANMIYEKNIENIVVFDDAAYSGEQLINRILLPLIKFFNEKNKEIKIFLIIPYITSLAKRRIEQVKFPSFISVDLTYLKHMDTLLEILTEEEKNILLNTEREEFQFLGATLTFFDHRVADDHSFFEEVAYLIDRSPKPYSEDTTYGQEEKKEWDIYWKKYLDFFKKEG